MLQAVASGRRAEANENNLLCACDCHTFNRVNKCDMHETAPTLRVQTGNMLIEKRNVKCSTMCGNSHCSEQCNEAAARGFGVDHRFAQQA